MKEIGMAETIYDYTQQIQGIDDIISHLEDLQTLYYKFKDKDNYKDVTENIKYWQGLQDELTEEREELIEKEVKEYDEEFKTMNIEFERSRL